MTNWLLVSSPENLETSRARGFDVAGMGSRHRSEWERVRHGDRVVFYLTGVNGVAGVARVSGDPFEGHEPIWTSSEPDERYPYRFPIEVAAVCDPGDHVAIERLARELDYMRSGSSGGWSRAPDGSVHELTDADTEVLESAVRLESGATPTA